MESQTQKIYHAGSVISLLALIVLCIVWEMFPLDPKGSWLALKALPLLVPLHGVIKRDVYTMQWSSMMILLYFIEGIVRGFSDGSMAGWIEVLLVFVFFFCTVWYLRPYKKAAKQLARQAIDKASK